MQVDPMAPLFLLVSAARSSTDTTRTVDVLLGTVALAYTARSATALPYGADLRVLLALIRHVTVTGEVRLTVPALLQAAGGYGGRQHEALFAALDRLAPSPTRSSRPRHSWGFRRIPTMKPDYCLSSGELQIELSPELLAQVLGVRAHPRPPSGPRFPAARWRCTACSTRCNSCRVRGRPGRSACR